MLARLAVLGIALSIASCQLLDPACSSILQPGIRVTVLDSISREPVPVEDVTVVAIRGNEVDTARAAGPVFVAIDNPGTYRVQITVDGYLAWTREDVLVGEHECGVRTTEIVALMRPDS